MHRHILRATVATGILAVAAGTIYARERAEVLPNAWILHAPQGAMTETDTMPQGAALSKDGQTLAVVESGFNPPTLRLLNAKTLEQTASISLAGAFGRPIWRDEHHVVVAGANADAVFDVDVATGTLQAFQTGKGTYPIDISLAPDGKTYAVVSDDDGSVRVGALAQLATVRPMHVGRHPAAARFSEDGKTLFVSVRSSSVVRAFDLATGTAENIAVGLHPGDMLVTKGKLYVAESDGDEVGVVDIATRRRNAGIFVGDEVNGQRLPGVSVNALALEGSTLFASLGAANSVAVIKNGRLTGRISTGWYPTDVVPAGETLYIINGKGEKTRANPHFDQKKRGNFDYVASLQYGSVRAYDLRKNADGGNPQGAVGWNFVPRASILRKGGPIRHVLFILKENRSYDQVMGDVRAGNGDPKLVWFGRKVTPNEHALAQRFGLFDNAYASGEVSSSGHKWANSAFANDYAERFWPPSYGNRRELDDLSGGESSGVPKNGFLWDAAARARVSFRDYGEVIDHLKGPDGPATTTAAHLEGRFDPRYVGWDLDYSDLLREKEWQREFSEFLARGAVPQFEFIWLPNDHTTGSRPGKLTPVACVATNDYAVGKIVEAISHSSIWKSSAIFVIEDDAQAGPDHVSDQRTTLFIASPYARGGLQHAHYSTLSVLRTIELILGIEPLSTYDAMAVPLYAAFKSRPDLRPYAAIPPLVDVHAKNEKTAYGAQTSLTMDFSRADVAPARTLTDILAHNHSK